MLEELQHIDTSAIDELKAIKQEQEVLQQRLAKMDEKKGAVSQAVYDRVKSDYQTRHRKLEERARPLKDNARAEFGKLSALLEQLGRDQEAARLAKEELTFRNELGEFDEAFFTEQMAAAETRLAECDAHLSEGQDLRAAFVTAFHSEEELLTPPPPTAGAGRPAKKAVPEPPPPPQPPESGPGNKPPTPPETAPAPEGTVVSRRAPFPAGEGTVVFASTQSPTDASPEAPDATAILTKPRLAGQRPDGTPEEFQLGFVATTIGRSPANDICISDDAVSRRHAKIVMSELGFTIMDLKSENGVYVNGERVTERLLVNGDVVEIGPGTRRYVFHAA